MASGQSLTRFRRYGPQRRCTECGAPVVEAQAFCPTCSVSLEIYPPELASNLSGYTQFIIPDYLIRAKRDRYRQTESTGTGFVLLGLSLVLVPAVTGSLSPPAVASLLTGFVLTGIGIVRARKDEGSMLRTGVTTAVMASLVLAFIGYQVLSKDSIAEDQTTNDAALIALAPESIQNDDAALAPDVGFATMAVARGSITREGVMPGPALAGSPYRDWRYDTGRDLKSAPVFNAGSAYLGTNDGFLLAIDLTTGLPKWRFDLGGYPVANSPTVHNRTVFVSSGYALFAIDEERGTERWRFEMGYAGESSPVVAGETVYAASKENYLYAVNATTGEREWGFKTDGLIFGAPAVGEHLIVLGDDVGNVYGVDRDTGRTVWRFPAVLSNELPVGAVFSTPAIDNDRVIVTYQSMITQVLDLATGTPIWNYPVGGTASAAVDDNVIYVGSDDGAVYAFNYLIKNDPLWLFSTGDGEVSSPVLVDDALYVTAGPTLFALNRSTGAQLWRYPLGELATTDPVAADGTVYVGARDGNLYAITGDERENDEAAGS